MIAENKNDSQNWSGASAEVNADNGGKPNGGVATETNGRDEMPELYKKDILGELAKNQEESIWKRGGEKRIRYKND